MYGAVLGDLIDSSYEFDRSGKTKVFPQSGGIQLRFRPYLR